MKIINFSVFSTGLDQNTRWSNTPIEAPSASNSRTVSNSDDSNPQTSDNPDVDSRVLRTNS